MSITRQNLKDAMLKKPLQFNDEELFKKYVSENPDDAWGHYDYGKFLDNLHYLKHDLGREEEVVVLLEKALKIGVNEQYSGALKAVHKILGYNYFKLERWDKAEESLKEFFSRTEQQYIPSWAYRYRAMARFRLNEKYDTKYIIKSFEDLKESLNKERSRKNGAGRLVSPILAEEIISELLRVMEDPEAEENEELSVEQSMSILKAAEEYAAIFGLEQYVPSILKNIEERAGISGDKITATAAINKMISLDDLSDEAKSKIKEYYEKHISSGGETQFALKEKITILEKEVEKNKELTEKEKENKNLEVESLLDALEKAEGEKRKIEGVLKAERLKNSDSGNEEKLEKFFGTYYVNCPASVISSLKAADMIYKNVINSEGEVSCRGIVAEYRSAIESLFDNIYTKQFRKFCKKNNISSKTTDDRGNKVLYEAYKRKKTLSIGEFLLLRKSGKAQEQSAFIKAFFEVMNKDQKKIEFFENERFWSMLESLYGLKIFTSKMHTEKIRKSELDEIIKLLVGNYVNEDCVMHQLVKVNSEI